MLRQPPTMPVPRDNLISRTSMLTLLRETKQIHRTMYEKQVFFKAIYKIISKLFSTQDQLIGDDPPSSPSSSSSSSSSDGDDENEASFDSLFQSFSQKWLNTQLTHHVSLAAANAFWSMEFQYVSELHDLKVAEGISRKIPQFLQVRKNIYRDMCPDIKMSFVFLNKTDNSIIRINEDHTPLKQYQRNPNYQKLYEEAHIQVNYNLRM